MSQIVLTHALRQASDSLIFDVRQKNMNLKPQPATERIFNGETYQIYVEEGFRGFAASFRGPAPLRTVRIDGFFQTHSEAMMEAIRRAEAYALSEKETDEVRQVLSHVPGLRILALGRWSRTILGWLCGATILLVVAVWIIEQLGY